MRRDITVRLALMTLAIILFFSPITAISIRTSAEKNNQYKLAVVFDSIKINNKHKNGVWSWIPGVNPKGKWKVDVYVNEKPLHLSAGSGLDQVDNGDTRSFVGKEATVSIPSNSTLRIVTAGFEQNSNQTTLPDISNDLKDAIPTINIRGVVTIGGSNVAAMYNIAKKIIAYHKDDPIGIISKEYSSDSNFGIGEHADCSLANNAVADLRKQQGTSCDFILKYQIVDVDHRLPAAKWHDWEKIDVPFIISTPAAASYDPGIFYLLALDQNGNLLLPYYDYGLNSTTKVPVQTLTGQSLEPSSSQPALFTYSPDRLYLFVLDTNESLWYNFYTVETGGWHGWEKFGDSFLSGPTVFNSTTKQMSIYALKDDNYIYQRKYDLGRDQWVDNWDRMTFLGNKFSNSPPTLVLPKGTVNRLDVFAALTNGSLWHGWFKTEKTSGPNSKINWNLTGVEELSNFNFTSQPSVISSNYSGPLDLFVQLSNNTLEHGVYKYDTKQWIKWESMGNISSSPVVVSPSVDRIDIFYLNNTSLMHKWYGN
jgi:hypothetical protein